jgi:hypothetical protein
MNNRRFLNTVGYIFGGHLALVILISVFIVYCKIFQPGPYEAPLIWGLLTFIDFPLSLVLVFTAGYCSVGVPFFFHISEQNWVFFDILWPSVVFQLVGTTNWILVVVFLKYLSNKMENWTYH